MRLTGLDVQENQARRLLNDLDEFRTLAHPTSGDDENFAAHQWLTHIFEPTVRAVPRDLRGKLEPAQVFHEVLDHRWYLAQSAGHDVPMPVATASYVKHVLPSKEDEKAVLGRSLAEMTAELPGSHRRGRHHLRGARRLRERQHPRLGHGPRARRG